MGKYKVGDRVVFTRNYSNGPLLGLGGTIVYIGGTVYAVEFDDEFCGGHNCSSRGRYRRCWWCLEDELDREGIEFVPCFDSIFDLLS